MAVLPDFPCSLFLHKAGFIILVLPIACRLLLKAEAAILGRRPRSVNLAQLTRRLPGRLDLWRRTVRNAGNALSVCGNIHIAAELEEQCGRDDLVKDG